VVKGFVVQFGISGFPSVSTAWQNANLKDDPVKASNTVGTITYADAGPNTRTTQVFINLGNNAANLDAQGFAPFGKVTAGMTVVNKLYGGYDDQPTNLQGAIESQGNSFLKKRFPKLDSVLRARIVKAQLGHAANVHRVARLTPRQRRTCFGGAEAGRPRPGAPGRPARLVLAKAARKPAAVAARRRAREVGARRDSRSRSPGRPGSRALARSRAGRASRCLRRRACDR